MLLPRLFDQWSQPAGIEGFARSSGSFSYSGDFAASLHDCRIHIVPQTCGRHDWSLRQYGRLWKKTRGNDKEMTRKEYEKVVRKRDA
jgi:hypothetical protein